MTVASLASAPTSQSTSAATSTTGTPRSSLSPDTTYTRYADKLEDVPQPELEEDHDGGKREEDVDDISTTTLESLQTESPMNVHDAEMLITQGEAAATATATGSLDLFTSRINMVSDWAMSRLPLTSSSSYSSAASLSSTTTSDSGSTAGTVKKSPLSEAGVWPFGVLLDANRETSTSTSSSSDATVQGRIPWEAKGKKKEDATPPVVSSKEEGNVRLRRNQAAPRTRRKSMTEKRRVIPIYHEPGFSRDFLLVVAMCFGLACAIILIIRPAFLRISSHGIDDYDFYDQ
ncbi:hypothetical protein CPC08DRAFT_432696 [Agrocybe pediades]|nr:hypothetical protein CPC08DRAFT_432696 [Agrocybe pediades]